MQSLKFGFLVVSRIVDGDILKGFNIVDSLGTSNKASLEAITKLGFQPPYKNAEFDAQYNTLVGKRGNVLSKYPSVDTNMARTSKDGITILATILDKDTKKPIGVVAFNSVGGKFNLTYKKLSELARKYINCNFDMVNDTKYGYIAVQKDGSYFETVEMSVAKKEGSKDDFLSPVDRTSPDELPTVKVYSMDFLKDNEFSQPCQEKLVETMINMQKLTPYYYTVLQAIKRLPTPNLGTLAVTEDTLHYDIEFVSRLRIPVLTFVLIHEILHLAMQHPVRIGNRKNHKLWNIATDLYINTIICNDFGCKYGGGVVNHGTREKPVEIQAPDFGVFIESIGESIDLAIDTPESIYARLLDENEGNGGNKGSKPQSGGSQTPSDQLNQGCDNLSKGAEKIEQQVNQTGTPEQRKQAQRAKKNLDEALDKLKDSFNSKDSEKLDEAIDDVDKAMSELSDSLEKSQDGSEKSQSGGDQSSSGGNQSDGSQSSSGGNQSDGSQSSSGGNQSDGSQSSSGGNQSGGSQGISSGGSQSSSSDGNQSSSGGSLGDAGKAQMEVGEQQIADALTGKGEGSHGNIGSPNDTPQTVEGDLSEEDDNNNAENGMRDIEVIYNGKKLKGTIMEDVMTNKNPKNEEDVAQNIENSKKALQRISTKIQIEEEKLGEPLSKNAGDGANLTARYIAFGLSAGVDWRVLLKNMCKDKPKKTFTLSQPNETYMNMGVTLAGRRAIGKPTHISHVKWAVDVSGSVTQKELSTILSEINSIFSHFKVDGELLYWSTLVGDAGDFSSLKDMLKIKPVSSGGTDVRCVFEYLSGETKVNKKREPDKVKDIKAVFILTDGYFSQNYAEYQKAFGRKVIWLITGVKGNPITFNPPFGKVIGLNLE